MYTKYAQMKTHKMPQSINKTKDIMKILQGKNERYRKKKTKQNKQNREYLAIFVQFL